MIVHVNPSSNQGVKTPQEALNVLRKASGEKKMLIHSGVYYGTKLNLTKEDKGLTIEGVGKGRAILSGGIPITDWKIDEKTGWFYAQAPIVDGKAVIGNVEKLNPSAYADVSDEIGVYTDERGFEIITK